MAYNDGPWVTNITDSSGTTAWIHDKYAHELINNITTGGLSFIKSTNAATTPQGIVWNNNGNAVTGTLVASASTKPYIYLVPATNTGTKDVYREYVTIQDGASYSWEQLGDANDAVTQTSTTSVGNYRILLSNSETDATETAGVKKAPYFWYDPALETIIIGDPESEHTIIGKRFIQFNISDEDVVTLNAGDIARLNLITLEKINEWNDSIRLAGTGLSRSGSTVNHSNSVTAQTTQAVYPIKIDAQGHISGYGSAVTNIVQTTATQTLTNKTLTAPTMTSPVISSGGVCFPADEHSGGSNTRFHAIRWGASASGSSTTITMPRAGVYIIIGARINNSTTTNHGLWILQAHGTTSSYSAVKAPTAGAPTIEPAGLSLKLTTGTTNYYFTILGAGSYT